MKPSYLLTLVFFISVQCIYAQSPYIKWQKSYDSGSNSDFINELTPTPLDSGYLCVGRKYHFISNNTAYYDTLWITKLDKDFNETWSTTLPNVRPYNNASVFQRPDSSFVILGNTFDNFPFFPISRNCFLLELDKNGNTITLKNITFADLNYLARAYEAPDGFIIGGYTEFSSGFKDAFSIVKINLIGNLVWSQIISCTKDCRGYNMEYTSDSSIVMGGDIQDGNLGYTVPYTDIPRFDEYQTSVLFKLSPNGTLTFVKKYFGFGMHSMIHTKDEGFLFSTHFDSNNQTDTNYGSALTKVDSLGNIQWRLILPFLHSNNLLETSTGDFLMNVSSDEVWRNARFIKVDSSGRLLDYENIDAPPTARGYTNSTTLEMDNGDYLVGGSGLDFTISQFSSGSSIAVADFDSLELDTTITINLLANDISEIGDSLVVTDIFPVSNSNNTLTIIDDSTVFFQPDNGFLDYDLYEYEVTKFIDGVEIMRDTNMVVLVVSLPVSTSKIQRAPNQIRIFPQPVKNQFTLELMEQDKRLESIQLYNAQMQLVKDFGSTSSHQKVCDMSDLPTGFYFIIINNTFVEKIIKQ